MMYDFNLLVSCGWGSYYAAKVEVVRVLEELSDRETIVQRTIARGIIGVRTSLNTRRVVERIWERFLHEDLVLRFATKWVPIDIWAFSDLESIKACVDRLKNLIGVEETWRMTVEKRRYTKLHKIEIIQETAELIDRRVDLDDPDKILFVEIIGKYAGLSVLKPEDIFSIFKPYPRREDLHR